MGRFAGNDAERIGVNENIKKNEREASVGADGQQRRAFGTDISAERDSSATARGCCARAEEKNTDNVGEGVRGIADNVDSDNGAVSGFTVMGLIMLILSLAALGFGVYLACVCFSSAAATSGALAAVLSIVSGGAEAAADAIGDAVVGLVSGVISTVAFGAATVILGRIARLLAKKVRESEGGALALLAKIASVAALILSSAVFVVAALIIIPWG